MRSPAPCATMAHLKTCAMSSAVSYLEGVMGLPQGKDQFLCIDSVPADVTVHAVNLQDL